MSEIKSPLFNLLLETVRSIPEAEGLSEDVLGKICSDALAQGTAQNKQWLLDRLEAAQRQTLDGAAVPERAGATLAPEGMSTGASGEPKKGYVEVPVSQPTQISSPVDLEAVLIRHGDWIQSVLHPEAAIAAGRANFNGADLSEIHLDGVDLRGAMFKGTNLTRASLQKTNLTTANFENANLQEANLQGAKLKKANLQGAQLVGARLVEADLRGARLKGAHWEGADLKGALIDDPHLLALQQAQQAAACRSDNENEGIDSQSNESSFDDLDPTLQLPPQIIENTTHLEGVDP